MTAKRTPAETLAAGRRQQEVAVRRLFAVILAVLAVMFGYVTLTIPAIAATAPALLTIACIVGVVLLARDES